MAAIKSLRGRLHVGGDPADLELARRRRPEQHVQQTPFDRRTDEDRQRRIDGASCPCGGSTQTVVSEAADPAAVA